MMLFESYYRGSDKEDFLAKVKAVAARLGINPDWLMGVMYKESRLNPGAVNGSTGASGLIQFMPDTAAALGTSTAALRKMTGSGQLLYIEKYYRPYMGRLHSFPDLYLATFFPAALGKSDEYVMQTSRMSASLVAGQNPAVDLNKDLQITVAEFKQYCYKGFSAETVETLKKKHQRIDS